MEAVPKLPMIYFELKISPVCPDFATPFKSFISKHYSEDGNSYDREIHELETLRNKACRAPRDFTGCSLLKRYYSQIYSLQNRFSVFDSNVNVECVWADIYSGQTMIGDLDFELAGVLYNIGALHAELGALDLRNSAESMKVACTHFQCAVWAFQHLRDDNRHYKSKDMSYDMLSFFVQVMLSQAQECILEKSMLDNRKSSIVAKVAAQVVEYYSSSLLMLLQSAVNTNASHTIVDIVGSKIYKEWKKFIELKVAYYNSICALFMGNLAEEQQKMGERVAWFDSAQVKLNEAIKLAKGMDRQEVSEALAFVADVIDVKVGNAKKENDFVYHEKVPTVDKLTEVKGVSLVKGIPFSICDPEISGPDIFARLVPMEAHETASIYSAKKDEIMRNIRIKIDDKNQELVAFMSSLQLEKETLRSKNEDIPDELIDVCAAMSVNPRVVNEVNDVLNELEEISDEVDKALNDTKVLLEEEERKEKEHQHIYGQRPSSMIVVELSKELAKHEETHKKAMLSNCSLRENLERHCDDVKLLISSSAQDVASLLPSTGANVPFDSSNLAEMEKLLEKVEEMKSQRLLLENQLKETMAADDIMKQVLAHNRKEIEEVFANEIKKYDRIVSLIEQNLSAQDNILRALTKANAKYSETRRAIMDNERNRSARITSLIHTYEVFKELQSNSKRGFDFYQKFHNIVIRLQARTRGVCRVQDEERDQISSAQKQKNAKYFPENKFSINGQISTAPKLKDYLPQSISQTVPRPMIHPVSQETQPQQFSMPQQITQSMPQSISQPMPQPMPQSMHQHVPQSMPQNMAQTIPQSLPQSTPQSITPSIPQPISQQFTQYTQHIPQSMPQQMPHYTQPMPQTTSQQIPQYMQPIPQSQQIPQYTQTIPQYTQSIPQTISHPMPQSMPQSVPQTMLQSMPQSVPHSMQHYTQPTPQYTQPNHQYSQQIPQYSQPVPQFTQSIPQQTQPIPQQMPQYGQQVSQYTQPMPQFTQQMQQYIQPVQQHMEPIPQPIQPLPLPIQPIESSVQKPFESNNEKPSENEGSELLKQFDPLYELNNGF